MISILGLSGNVLGAKPSETTMTLTIGGETTEVLAWSWGASNNGISLGGGGAIRANFQNISVTKFTDALSSKLLLRVATGEISDSAVLQSGSITITMSQVLVTSISTGRSGRDPSYENISLDFNEFVFLSDGVEACWNKATGTQC